MKIFEPIYNKILSWAKHPHAECYLAGISFAESSFFPIPVDVMLAPMVFANKQKAWRLALITTLMSVAGGMFGYLIGAFLFESYGQQMLNVFHAHETFESIKLSYKEHGMMIVLLAGVTPIPYKIFTIASGVMGVAVIPFILMSILGRGVRFFAVAGLIKLGGDKLEKTIHKKIEWFGWGSLVFIVLAFTIYKLL